MSRPTPTTCGQVQYALRLAHQGWVMDRNGQLAVFASHKDAVDRLNTVRGPAEIVPVEIRRAT